MCVCVVCVMCVRGKKKGGKGGRKGGGWKKGREQAANLVAEITYSLISLAERPELSLRRALPPPLASSMTQLNSIVLKRARSQPNCCRS